MEEGSKLYYTVGDVAKILGENASLVRFWSDKFSTFIKPVRNKKGNRFFTQKDIGTFKMIYHLVKESGMTLEGAKARLKQNLSGVDSKMEVIEKLRGIRARLVAVMNDTGMPSEEAENESEENPEVETNMENHESQG
ncbi:MAG: MerR family transcriptional regulator [Bacteroidales bacterium]|nr:MerR family transcriptional regulator [Bacteroidales bacterium]MBR2136103.1 MerR family transcriptional regulator [Bacteroidales bacterium]